MKKHHLPNGRFRNNSKLNMTHSSVTNVFKWKLELSLVKRINFPVVEQSPSELEAVSDRRVTWIGHASFLIQFDGLNILTDPHFSKRASPVQFAGPKRTTQPAIALSDLPHIDVVVVSHDHYDHLDLKSVRGLHERQKDNPPLFVVPLRVGEWLSKRGIDSWVELDWGESTQYKDWTFHAVPVQHFSGRGLKPNNTLWAGWVLEHKAESDSPYKLFFAGDTGYSDDFRDIGERFGEMDLSLLPIGAYEPRWFMKEVHVNPEEAVQIHLDVKSKKSIGMHWGSFILTDEAMDEPPKKLELAKSKHGLSADEFIVVDHGEAVKI